LAAQGLAARKIFTVGATLLQQTPQGFSAYHANHEAARFFGASA